MTSITIHREALITRNDESNLTFIRIGILLLSPVVCATAVDWFIRARRPGDVDKQDSPNGNRRRGRQLPTRCPQHGRLTTAQSKRDGRSRCVRQVPHDQIHRSQPPTLLLPWRATATWRMRWQGGWEARWLAPGWRISTSYTDKCTSRSVDQTNLTIAAFTVVDMIVN